MVACTDIKFMFIILWCFSSWPNRCGLTGPLRNDFDRWLLSLKPAYYRLVGSQRESHLLFYRVWSNKIIFLINLWNSNIAGKLQRNNTDVFAQVYCVTLLSLLYCAPLLRFSSWSSIILILSCFFLRTDEIVQLEFSFSLLM